MSENTKIAALAPPRQMLGLKSVGVKVFEAESAEEAEEKLGDLAGESELRLVLISERLAEQIGAEAMAEMRDRTGKIFMALPSHEGTSGLAETWLKEAMERSIGVDLISD